MKPINECKTVAELLESPERWTKGEYAKDNDDNQIDVFDPRATCFCVQGAIQRVYKRSNDLNDEKLKLETLLKQMELIGECGFLCDWNDNPETTHEMVLDVVRRAGI
jgi:hypothetical protein